MRGQRRSSAEPRDSGSCLDGARQGADVAVRGGGQGRAPSHTVTVAPSDEATGALPGTGPCSPPGGVRCGAHGVRPPSYFEFHEATAGTTAVSVDTVLSILRAGRKEPRKFRLRSSLRLRQPKRLVGVALGQSAQVEGAR